MTRYRIHDRRDSGRLELADVIVVLAPLWAGGVLYRRAGSTVERTATAAEWERWCPVAVP